MTVGTNLPTEYWVSSRATGGVPAQSERLRSRTTADARSRIIGCRGHISVAHSEPDNIKAIERRDKSVHIPDRLPAFRKLERGQLRKGQDGHSVRHQCHST